jgi:hypothetical protein
MATTTLQQERRELWDSILDEVRERDPDPARTAACSLLLDHLIRSAVPPALDGFPSTHWRRDSEAPRPSLRLSVAMVAGPIN